MSPVLSSRIQMVLLCGLHEHCALSAVKSSLLSFAADIHALLPIKNNRIVAASNKSSLGECTVTLYQQKQFV